MKGRWSGASKTPSGGEPGKLGASPLPPGDPERYDLVDEHARGGLGRIIRARDNHLGRTVAVKELLSRSPSSEARFVREAMITARLQHPGIVPVHEAGRWPSGEPYYVMKLVSGSTLKEQISRSVGLAARLALLPHAIAVFETIGYAHSKNIIHRDLKPSNVVVGEYGETVVVDWGLAKDLAEPHGDGDEAAGAGDGESGRSGESADDTADVVGTPAYMPPEQARGEEVDKRADVYALGALLYHLLTGSAPYSRRSRDVSSGDKLIQVLEGPPRPIADLEPGVAPDLVAIVEKAMARDRADRYADAAELAEDLKRFSTGKLVTAQEYSSVQLVRRWIHRNRAPVAAAVVGLIATAIVGALGINRIINERNTAQRERTQAQAAQRSSEEKANELVYQQAAASLESDPTAAIAWLKRYPIDGPRADRVADMVEEARARGVATHVFPHDDWVHAIDFTAGGRELLSASQDGTVSLWDLETGRRELLFSGSSGILAGATSPSRSMAAYGAADGAVHVIDLETRESFELLGHHGPVRTVRFIGDSNLLMSLAEDQLVRIWDLETRKTKKIFKATSKPSRGGTNRVGTHVVDIADSGLIRVHDVVADKWREIKMPPFPLSQKLAVSADGARLASAGTDGKIRLIDLDRRAVTLLGEHPGQIGYADFSPSGKWLVTASSDTTIRLWDLAGGEPIVLRGHTDSVYQVDFSPDETRMISASDDRTARIWDLRTQTSVALRGHSDDVWKALWSPDGKRVATASLDGNVRIWPTRFDDSRVLVGHRDKFVSHVDFASGELLSQGRDGQLLRWNLETGEPTEIGVAWRGLGYPQWESKEPVFLSRDRARGVSRREDGKLDLWDLRGGEHRVLEPPEGFVGSRLRMPAISIDGKRVAASDTRRVVEWNLEDGTTAVIDRDEVATLAYDPGGALLMGIYDAGIVERQADGSLRRLKTDGFIDANMFFFSEHGEVLGALSHGGKILVIDRATGDTMTVATSGHTLVSAAMSADGKRVAGAGADRRVYVWDVDTGREQIFEGHTDLVHRVVFSPDGRLLASSAHDKTVRLWDLATGQSRVLRGHAHSVHDVSFSPDGKLLASAGRDGTVRVWKVPDSLSNDIARVRPQLHQLTSAIINDNEAVPVTPVAGSSRR